MKVIGELLVPVAFLRTEMSVLNGMGGWVESRAGLTIWRREKSLSCALRSSKRQGTFWSNKELSSSEDYFTGVIGKVYYCNYIMKHTESRIANSATLWPARDCCAFLQTSGKKTSSTQHEVKACAAFLNLPRQIQNWYNPRQSPSTFVPTHYLPTWLKICNIRS